MSRPPIIVVTELSQAELACRLAEAFFDMPRPTGATAAQALDVLHDSARQRLLNAATAAAEYMQECVSSPDATTVGEVL